MSVNETGSKLTPLQLGALVVLMAEAREVTNGELEEMAGFRLKRPDRIDLEACGFIESRKGARGELAFQLTDEGWSFCKQLHESDVNVGRSTAARSIFVLLGGLHRSLDRLRISHADFFKQQTGTTPLPLAEAVDGGDIEAQIRSAYNDLARGPGDWVGLADLREHLVGVNRTAVDTALRAMLRQAGVRIIPVANTKALRPRDRAAALHVGDTDTHALAIGQT